MISNSFVDHYYHYYYLFKQKLKKVEKFDDDANQYQSAAKNLDWILKYKKINRISNNDDNN